MNILDSVLRSAMEACEAGDWDVVPGEVWCSVTPKGRRERAQGWKLHVSAIPLASPVVLSLAAPVLLHRRCSFKFAKDLTTVEDLTASHGPRGSGGKFITVYPRDDDELVEIADALHDATLGLPGPPVLSDRRYKPDSLVFLRYGAVRGTSVLTNEGVYESMLVAPDGTMEKDRREAYFTPPSWAAGDFADASGSRSAASAGRVRLNGRFEVTGAIKHSYGGGVFRARDAETGEEAVIKQARRWAGSDLSGTDASDDLRNEAEVLGRLARTGAVPRLLDLFGRQGDLFLAQERIPGTGLRAWVDARLTLADDTHHLPSDRAHDAARQLVGLVGLVHGEGLVIRDLNPNNIMVTPDDRLRLVDMEHCVADGSVVSSVMTLGYAAPESGGDRVRRHGTVARGEADVYSLGATLFFLATGVDPLLPEDDGDEALAERDERLRRLLTVHAARNTVVRSWQPLLEGLLRTDPGDRWTLERAGEYLAPPEGKPPTGPRTSRLSVRAQDLLIEDGLSHLLETMRPDAPRLWPSAGFGASTDPLAVQHGAAGVLAVLCRAARLLGSAPARDGAATAAHWIRRRLADEPRVLPGLYFGRSGVAWALHDAADLLGDERLAHAARRLADRIPLRWENPDVCHGTSGAGMTMLHLWESTGDTVFRERALTAAERVAAAATRTGDGARWPIPTTFDGDLAGVDHLGFAHGVAGNSAFLLRAGQRADRPDLIALAEEGARTLARTVIHDAGAAYWPSGEEAPGQERKLTHWCSGSSGVGTFLVHLWQRTGDDEHRFLAERAAVAVRRTRWSDSPSMCHGLAGNGEFLLDLAEAWGDDRYREWARELAECVDVRRTRRGRRLVTPDETNHGVVADFGTGVAGTLSFLLRLRHGGTRLFMPGEETRDSGGAAADRVVE
ncbi:class IV lanthionine synthetase LanL [Streptomyces sp. NPDC055607]